MGNKDSDENKPVIGDFVAFGPGAKAFGKIIIGNNVFVAANSVVTKDIPSNTIVGGIPAHFLRARKPINVGYPSEIVKTYLCRSNEHCERQ